MSTAPSDQPHSNRDPGSVAPVFHLALAAEWADVVASGRSYERSTIDQSLAEVGFVHLAFGPQVAAVVQRYYAGRTDVVVLAIDPSRLDAELRVENTSGGTELFPHLYGSLPASAVVGVTPLAEFPLARE